MKNSCKVVILSLFFLILGCDTGNENLDAISETISSFGNEVGDRVMPYTKEAEKVPAMAEEEFEKLFQFEYQVVEISSDSNATELRNTLGSLGRQRWDCFHVHPQGEKLLLFCKKRPKSYLRYLGHLW